jgi:hypothetical protein
MPRAVGADRAPTRGDPGGSARSYHATTGTVPEKDAHATWAGAGAAQRHPGRSYWGCWASRSRAVAAARCWAPSATPRLAAAVPARDSSPALKACQTAQGRAAPGWSGRGPLDGSGYLRGWPVLGYSGASQACRGGRAYSAVGLHSQGLQDSPGLLRPPGLTPGWTRDRVSAARLRRSWQMDGT